MMFLNHYPLARFGTLGREMNRFFDDVFPGFDRIASRRSGTLPSMNVWEEGDCVWVEAEVAGLDKDDIDVQVGGNELTIRGKHAAVEDDGLTYHHRERTVGDFSRTLTLPFEVNADEIEATLRDGLLTVKLPKAASAKARTIQVKSD